MFHKDNCNVRVFMDTKSTIYQMQDHPLKFGHHFLRYHSRQLKYHPMYKIT
jgi:hypothetical protein